MAQCVPVKREALEMDFAALDGEAARRFVEVTQAVNEEPGVYRRRFRAQRRVAEAGISAPSR